MIMKKLFYVLMAIVPFLLCGCKDDRNPQQKEESDPEVNDVPMVSRLVFENVWGSYYGFEYDSKGRMERITSGEEEGESTEITCAQVYYEDRQVTKIMEGGAIVTYELDEDGKVVKASPSFIGDGDERDYVLFEYDGNGYMKSATVPYYEDGALFTLKVKDGNYTSIASGDNAMFIEYTDYPNNYSIDLNFYLIASATWTPFYCLWFSKFPGANSANLIKRISDNGVEVTYYYSFDSYGRVSSITINKSYKDDNDAENIVVTMNVKYEE